MSRAMRWTAMRPGELPDVVVVHPLSAPDEPVTYVREDDETVDAFKLALEIVRCRDCKSWAGPCCDDHEQGTCSGWSAASGMVLMVTNADDFCSYGKRATE